MVKLNKTILSFIIVFFLSAQDLFGSFIIDDVACEVELKAIHEALKLYNEEVEKNIEAIQANNNLLTQKMNLTMQQLLGLQEYLLELKIAKHTLEEKRE